MRVAGHGVITYVGSAGLRMLVFKTGLTGALSAALAVPGRVLVHDRGQVLTDLAVAIADGGTAVRHICTLRDQGVVRAGEVRAGAGRGGDRLESVPLVPGPFRRAQQRVVVVVPGRAVQAARRRAVAVHGDHRGGAARGVGLGDGGDHVLVEPVEHPEVVTRSGRNASG